MNSPLRPAFALIPHVHAFDLHQRVGIFRLAGSRLVMQLQALAYHS
jgi:hypothetical protein